MLVDNSFIDECFVVPFFHENKEIKLKNIYMKKNWRWEKDYGKN